MKIATFNVNGVNSRLKLPRFRGYAVPRAVLVRTRWVTLPLARLESRRVAPVAFLFTHTSQTYPPFHDVTSGTNGQYSAGSGWDPVSGLGTPDLWNIARDLEC